MESLKGGGKTRMQRDSWMISKEDLTQSSLRLSGAIPSSAASGCDRGLRDHLANDLAWPLIQDYLVFLVIS